MNEIPKPPELAKQAIHIATANGAQFLAEANRIGSIAPGKQADLVVIKGDPSRKIDDIENVEIPCAEQSVAGDPVLNARHSSDRINFPC
jgi:imidazolonepropionase-like amidohydrolase